MGNHVIYDALWESDRLAECSREAALAYPWIFLVADDHGRFEYKPRAIWKNAFAYRDDVTIQDVAGWLDEYWKAGLLIRYHVHGDLAHWYKFRGRKPSERRPSEYPDPQGIPVFTPEGATLPRRGGDEGATRGRKRGVRDRAEIEQSRDRAERNPAAGAAPLQPIEIAPEDETARTESTALVVAPLPWNREAAELWWAEYKGDPPKAFFGALKSLVKRETWERVRPALVTYMAETPAEFVNIAGKFVAAFGTWEARSRGLAPRSPPKETVADRSRRMLGLPPQNGGTGDIGSRVSVGTAQPECRLQPGAESGRGGAVPDGLGGDDGRGVPGGGG